MDEMLEKDGPVVVDEDGGRREFLRKCGKYAVVVPPTMALLFSKSNRALAQSGEPPHELEPE